MNNNIFLTLFLLWAAFLRCFKNDRNRKETSPNLKPANIKKRTKHIFQKRKFGGKVGDALSATELDLARQNRFCSLVPFFFYCCMWVCVGWVDEDRTFLFDCHMFLVTTCQHYVALLWTINIKTYLHAKWPLLGEMCFGKFVYYEA